ncbi:MAG: trypsin-like peptidase domain-containing protein [Acholeplasmatales bacterium]|nr:trypsin-like peptidase domain-containing protein [Acholeplasmatales bacterium]
MNTKIIASYYSNARELIKCNLPKEARLYVLQILNYALEYYRKIDSILSKVKTELFMEKWIRVSKDLYEFGITDYVLECFNLDNPKSKNIVKFEKKKEIEKNTTDDLIDFEDLVNSENVSQGWCADVFDKNRNAIVKISAIDGNQTSNGTGFIISKNGYLLTNDHIIYNTSSDNYYPKMYMITSENIKIKIELQISDKKNDIALCKFNVEDVSNIESVNRIKDYSKLKQGADCLVIGNPFDMGLAPFTGIVKYTKNRSGDLVYSAPSNPGDSGGPVFNRTGECIGINKSKTYKVNNEDVELFANATPMDTIDAFLNKWSSTNNIEF